MKGVPGVRYPGYTCTRGTLPSTYPSRQRSSVREQGPGLRALFLDAVVRHHNIDLSMLFSHLRSIVPGHPDRPKVDPG